MISDIRGHVAYVSETASLMLSSYINGVGDGSTVTGCKLHWYHASTTVSFT